jgi:hypothetical protein
MAKAVNAIRGSDKRHADSLENLSLQLCCEYGGRKLNIQFHQWLANPCSVFSATAILSKWIFEERHPLDEFSDSPGRKIFWKDGEERRSYNKERKVAV